MILDLPTYCCTHRFRPLLLDHTCVLQKVLRCQYLYFCTNKATIQAQILTPVLLSQGDLAVLALQTGRLLPRLLSFVVVQVAYCVRVVVFAECHVSSTCCMRIHTYVYVWYILYIYHIIIYHCIYIYIYNYVYTDTCWDVSTTSYCMILHEIAS